MTVMDLCKHVTAFQTIEAKKKIAVIKEKPRNKNNATTLQAKSNFQKLAKEI
jgi:hypothetical protein